MRYLNTKLKFLFTLDLILDKLDPLEPITELLQPNYQHTHVYIAIFHPVKLRLEL